MVDLTGATNVRYTSADNSTFSLTLNGGTVSGNAMPGLDVWDSIIAQSVSVAAYEGTTHTDDFTAVKADDGVIFLLSGEHSLTFASCVSLGAKWSVTVRNIGTGRWTLARNGAPDTINGLSQINLFPGESCTVVCDGLALYTIGLSARVPLKSGLALASATLDLVTSHMGLFDTCELVLSDCRPSVDDGNMAMVLTDDEGATWETGASAYAYAWGYAKSDNTAGSVGSTGAAYIPLFLQHIKDSGGSAIITLPSPSGTYGGELIINGSYRGTGPSFVRVSAMARLLSGLYNGVRLYNTAGNFTGRAALYGIRRT